MVNRLQLSLQKYVRRNPFDIICWERMSSSFPFSLPSPTPKPHLLAHAQSARNAAVQAAWLSQINWGQDGGKSFAVRANLTRVETEMFVRGCGGCSDHTIGDIFPERIALRMSRHVFGLKMTWPTFILTLWRNVDWRFTLIQMQLVKKRHFCEAVGFRWHHADSICGRVLSWEGRGAQPESNDDQTPLDTNEVVCVYRSKEPIWWTNPNVVDKTICLLHI